MIFFREYKQHVSSTMPNLSQINLEMMKQMPRKKIYADPSNAANTTPLYTIKHWLTNFLCSLWTHITTLTTLYKHANIL